MAISCSRRLNRDWAEVEGKKFPINQGMLPSWNQEAFAVLSNLFQMTVTDLTRFPTLAMVIAK